MSTLEKKTLTPEPQDFLHAVDVTIIGGGMAGPAIAHSLQNLGLSIRVLDGSRYIGSGESAKSMEQFRGGWGPKALYDLMQRSLPAFVNPQNVFGDSMSQGALGVRPRPYLWLATTPEAEARYRTWLDVLNARGYTHASYIDPHQARELCPWLPEQVRGGMLDQMTGQVDSRVLANQFLNHTDDKTKAYVDTPAEMIVVEGGKVTGVKTNRGTIATGAVIIAAGHNSRKLAETAGDGITIPVTCFPREQFTTQWRDPKISPTDPFVITENGAYFRSEGSGIIAAWANDNVGIMYPRDDASTTRAFVPTVLAELGTHLNQPGDEDGGFFDARYLSPPPVQMAGYYVERLGDDDRAVIASLQPLGVSGLFVSTGHSGHGVMTAPGAASVMRSVFIGDCSDPLVEQFSLTPPAQEAFATKL